MTAITENSRFCRALVRLWLALVLSLWESGTAKVYDRAERAVIRAFRGSVLWNFVSRRGVVLRAWPESVAARLIAFLSDLIPSLLRRLYLRFQPVWDGSAAFALAGGAGRSVPVVLSWLFLLMMVCPHRYWNNAYSLAFAVLTAALICVTAMRRTGGLKLEAARFNPYLWAFFFMLCVGVAESASRRVSLRYLVFFITAVLLSLAVVSSVSRVEQLKRLAAFGAAGMVVSALYAVYQLVVLGITNTSSTVDLDLNVNMPGRVYSFFDNANTYAQVLVMLLGVTMGLLFASRTLRGKLASLIALGAGLAAIAMTYSRASWVGLAAAVLLFILLAERRLLPVLLLAVVALLPFLPPSIYNRILTIFDFSDSSTSSRFPIYEVGFRIWKTSPITGVGLGSELSSVMAHNSGWYHQLFKFPHYHNIYLQLAVETGLLGAAAYVGGFLAACKDSIRAIAAPQCDKALRYMTAGCVSGLAGVMVCGLADYFWHYPRVMAIFWLIFGMMLCGIKLARPSAEQ